MQLSRQRGTRCGQKSGGTQRTSKAVVMPGAGRVKRRWLTSTVDRLFRAQQAATVTQRTDEIENKKICNGQPIGSGHAAHPCDPRFEFTELVASFSGRSNLSVSRAGSGFVIGEGRSVRVQISGFSE